MYPKTCHRSEGILVKSHTCKLLFLHIFLQLLARILEESGAVYPTQPFDLVPYNKPKLSNALPPHSPIFHIPHTS